MNILLTIKEQDIVPNAPEINSASFYRREAARGVVLDGDNQVYLLNVALYNYHKLPGGGIDEGEDKETAMKRECREEIGCDIEIIAKLGKIIEYRDQFKLIQTSHCYIARQVGEQRLSTFEPSEIAEGFRTIKALNIEDAIRIIEQDKSNDYGSKFMRKRELAILQVAKQKGF